MGYILVDSPNPYTAQGTYPRRGGFKPSGTIIVHTSEGAWNAGVDSLTNLVRSRSDYGCYHRACDWQDIAQYYPWEWECWQDSETNNWAVGIAAACRTTDWGNMPADVEEGYYRNLARMAADFVSYMQAEYGVTVPLRRITGAEARARVPGFCGHGDSGISRTDPGANFDWARFFKYTSQALTGSLSYASESTTPLKEGFLMALTEDEQRRILSAADRINGTIDQPNDKVLTERHLPEIATHVLNKAVPRGGAGAGIGDGLTSLGALVAWNDDHTIQVLSATAAAAASNGSSVEQIKAAVVDALKENVVKVQVSVEES